MSSGMMIRVSKRQRCPMCGKADWCLVAKDGTAAICKRVEQGSAKRCGEAGWLHRLKETTRQQSYYPRRRVISSFVKPAKDFAELAQMYQQRLTYKTLSTLAAQLGVSADSLRRLQVGWNGAGYTFPMRDETGRLIGLRVRYRSGCKVCETGSRQALFIPTALPVDGLLLICEGPTDTAAALDLGFAAVGRPSCNTGAPMLRRFASGRRVIIIADNDDPGRKGAYALASELILHCSDVRIIYPSDNVKDLRQWKAVGLITTELQRLIDAAPPIIVTVETRTLRRRKERA